jgi:hypothetical protein
MTGATRAVELATVVHDIRILPFTVHSTSHSLAFALLDRGIQCGRWTAQEFVSPGRVAHLADLFETSRQLGGIDVHRLADRGGGGSGRSTGYQGH